MIENSVRQASREAAPWVEALARLGYASKAAVYIVVGALTALSGWHHQSGAADRQDAFTFILQLPFGKVLLLIVALGLAGYALWRFSSAIADSENRGHDLKGLSLRVGSFIRGAAYGWIAIEVIRLVLHARHGSGGDANARHWTGKAMDQPFGRFAVAVAGAVIVGYGIYQLYIAWTAKLSKQLHTAAAHRWTIVVSRFGIGARGVIFAIVGWSLLVAAFHHDARDARGTSGAMQQLATQPFGHVLLTLAGVGLVAYGVYAWVNARYRVIRAL